MPLLFDMPLDKLKTYPGCNPKPADFDRFWDDSLAEMRALDPQVELVPASFQTNLTECLDLYFTGVGAAPVHAKLLRPRHSAGRHPAVLMFHGYAGHSGDWQSKLGYAAQGFTVAALDCRGQGGTSEDKGDVPGGTLRGHIVRGLDGSPRQLLFRQIFLDTAQLARIVMDMPGVDSNRVGATGISQGGGLTLACAALEPNICRPPPSSRFCATTGGSGRSISPRTPMGNSMSISAASTPAMNGKTKCSSASGTLTFNTSVRASGPRSSWEWD